MLVKMFVLVCLFVFCVHHHLVSPQHYYASGVICENATNTDATAYKNMVENQRETEDEQVAFPVASTGQSARCSFTDYLGLSKNVVSMLKLNVIKKKKNNDVTTMEERSKDNILEDRLQEVGRTFGLRRRMQLFLWLPISFKLGVIVTLLLVLTTMSLKTLILGFIILLLLLHHTNGHTKLWGAQRTPELYDFYKNVHIYVHNAPLESQHQNYVESWHGSSPTAIYHV